MRTDARPTRRSVLLAFLNPLRAPQPRRLQAARMTIAEGWDWLFRWCGFVPANDLPAAA